MIPSLRLPDSDYHGRSRSAFGRAGAARPLDIWVDTAGAGSSRELDHLLGYASHRRLHLVTTTRVANVDLAELMIDNGYAGARIDYVGGTEWIGGGPVATWSTILDSKTTLNGDSREEVLRSVLLATVGGYLTADIFVTAHEVVRELDPGGNALTPVEALAVIGLYLRAEDDFTVSGAPLQSYNRGLFYRLLARELVPHWGPTWRQLAAREDDPSFLNGLGHALILRLGAVLRARDRAHLELQLPPTNDTADEFLLALDALLLALDACFDVIARTLNHRYRLGRDQAARWRDAERWRTRLLAAEPRLTAVAGPGSLLDDSVNAIGALRLSFHGVPLQTIASSRGGSLREVENLLVVPPDARDILAAIVERRGGRSAWGLKPGIDGLIFVEPGPFVEALSRHAVEAVESLVKLAVGPGAELDPSGDWSATPEVLHQLRALSGTLDWNSA